MVLKKNTTWSKSIPHGIVVLSPSSIPPDTHQMLYHVICQQLWHKDRNKDYYTFADRNI